MARVSFGVLKDAASPRAAFLEPRVSRETGGARLQGESRRSFVGFCRGEVSRCAVPSKKKTTTSSSFSPLMLPLTNFRSLVRRQRANVHAVRCVRRPPASNESYPDAPSSAGSVPPCCVLYKRPNCFSPCSKKKKKTRKVLY